MKRNYRSCAGILPVLMIAALSGCSHGPAAVSSPSAIAERKVYDLKEITPGWATGFLSELGLGTVSAVPGRNAVVVTGSAEDLHRAGVTLDLVDTTDEYFIETLAPVSEARTIPTNSQIAEALGNAAIGTFAHPPQAGERVRAIIDIHGECVVAIIPARIQRDLLALIEFGPDGLRQVKDKTEPAKPPGATAGTADSEAAQMRPAMDHAESAEVLSAQVFPDVPSMADDLQEPAAGLLSAPAVPPESIAPEEPAVEADLTAATSAQVCDEPQRVCEKHGVVRFHRAESFGGTAGIRLRVAAANAVCRWFCE